MEKVCKVCGVSFKKPQTWSLKRWGNRRFCSYKCAGVAKRGIMPPQFVGQINPLRTHGMSKSKFYEVWKGMRYRCSNPKNKSYKDYGGRGISVCKRWQAFENFKIDMYEEYKKMNKDCNGAAPNFRASIERVDVDGNYEPKNCKWIKLYEQANGQKKCKNKKITRLDLTNLFKQGDKNSLFALIRGLKCKRFSLILKIWNESSF